jgi:large subunit ribosomal protein L4
VPKVTLYNMDGQQVGEIELNEKVFGAEVNEALLHQAVVMYQANRRQGTVATKTRGLVSGGGRKPWRQKGTGRARQGSTRSPQWRGGGTVFGPQAREYRLAMPQKMRQAALRSALSAKVAAGDMIVLNALSVSEPKTKLMANIIGRFDAAKALIVSDQFDKNLVLATQNLPGVLLSSAGDLNAYAVLSHGKLMITQDAIGQLEEALA